MSDHIVDRYINSIRADNERLERELAEAKMRRDEWIKESCRLGLIAENAQRELAEARVKCAGCEAAYYDLRKERDKLTEVLWGVNHTLTAIAASKPEGDSLNSLRRTIARIDAFMREPK